MPRCDTIICNATIVDGTGRPRFEGDLAIRGDRIAALGRLEGWTAGRATGALPGRALRRGRDVGSAWGTR